MIDLPRAFSPDVMKELAKPVQTYDPRAMQLALGILPNWYVIEVVSRDVEAELIKRQFGIYIPEEDETVITRGRSVDRRVRMFPGYVFVFLWDTGENWSKLASLRGVVAVLGVLSDAAIDKIRYCENCARPVVLQSFEIKQDIPPKKRRKRRRKTKRKIVVVHDEVTAVRAWSAFEDAVMTLDSEGRNQALRNVLGISS
jgi:transcription antitermination factor NusG